MCWEDGDNYTGEEEVNTKVSMRRGAGQVADDGKLYARHRPRKLMTECGGERIERVAGL